jgi:hypothetical protein
VGWDVRGNLATEITRGGTLLGGHGGQLKAAWEREGGREGGGNAPAAQTSHAESPHLHVSPKGSWFPTKDSNASVPMATPVDASVHWIAIRLSGLVAY